MKAGCCGVVGPGPSAALDKTAGHDVRAGAALLAAGRTNLRGTGGDGRVKHTPARARNLCRTDTLTGVVTPTLYPMLDLQSEVRELWPELQPAVERVLRSGYFIGGPEVERFEAAAAEYLGVEHAVGLNSGTDALILGLDALGVGPGDEVVTTAFSFFATSEAVLRLGATPVFVDIDPVSLNLRSDLVEAAITDRTKALLPVHVFGLPAPIEELRSLAARRGVHLLEDCAQSFGSVSGGQHLGSFGAVGAFSFYPTKNLGAYGDAGMLTTNDPQLAARVRSLRNHGSSPSNKYLHDGLGHNSRLDALQAAVLNVKLGHVADFNERRRERAGAYRQALSALPQGPGALQMPPDDARHVYHQFTIQVPADRRPALEAELSKRGVAFSRFYPTPLTHQPAGSDFGRAPEAELACQRVLSLPIHPWLPDAAIDAVAQALKAALA